MYFAPPLRSAARISGAVELRRVNFSPSAVIRLASATVRMPPYGPNRPAMSGHGFGLEAVARIDASVTALPSAKRQTRVRRKDLRAEMRVDVAALAGFAKQDDGRVVGRPRRRAARAHAGVIASRRRRSAGDALVTNGGKRSGSAERGLRV